jgi:VanZ family protein
MISWFEKHNKISWAITFFGGASIFYISSLKFGGGTSFGIFSIIYHFSAFFLLSFFLLISSVRGKNNSLVFVIAIFLAVTYGILDELHQFFVPGRTSTLLDMGIDSLGVVLASVIYFILIKYKNLQNTKL